MKEDILPLGGLWIQRFQNVCPQPRTFIFQLLSHNFLPRTHDHYQHVQMCVWVVEKVFQKSHANFNTSIKKYLIKIDKPIHYSIKKNPNFMTLFATSTTFLQ